MRAGGVALEHRGAPLNALTGRTQPSTRPALSTTPLQLPTLKSPHHLSPPLQTNPQLPLAISTMDQPLQSPATNQSSAGPGVDQSQPSTSVDACAVLS